MENINIQLIAERGALATKNFDADEWKKLVMDGYMNKNFSLSTNTIDSMADFYIRNEVWIKMNE